MVEFENEYNHYCAIYYNRLLFFFIIFIMSQKKHLQKDEINCILKENEFLVEQFIPAICQYFLDDY